MSVRSGQQCDHLNARIVDSDESADGSFYEVYRCPCGARGRIDGHTADPPNEWRRTGEVFRNA